MRACTSRSRLAGTCMRRAGTRRSSTTTGGCELAAGAVPHPAAVDLAGPVTGLPRRPVRVFEGRDEALGVLARALTARGGAVVTQAVYGLGGVGKSELALHYADARRGDYGLVWWITAADAGQVEAGLAGLAGRLCPVVAVAGTTGDAAGWATGWLQAHDRWLLILDNVEDPADIEPLLGQLGGGHVIVTSRRDADWGRLADPVQLDVLDPAAAAQVLILRTGQHGAVDEGAASRIAAELGFLPLALDQAAAYIVQQRISLTAYLDSLRRNPARMHAAGSNAQRTIARLWDLHVTAIRDRSPAAARLLGVLAMYAPDAIPRRHARRHRHAGGHRRGPRAAGLLQHDHPHHRFGEHPPAAAGRHPHLAGHVPGDDARSLRDTALDWLDHSHPRRVRTRTWPVAAATRPGPARRDAGQSFPARRPARRPWVGCRTRSPCSCTRKGTTHRHCRCGSPCWPSTRRPWDPTTPLRLSP